MVTSTCDGWINAAFTVTPVGAVTVAVFASVPVAEELTVACTV